MHDFDKLMAAEKASAALAVLHNPVFDYLIKDEISLSTIVAVNGPTAGERDEHRYNIIWLQNLLKRLRDLTRESDGGSSTKLGSTTG